MVKRKFVTRLLSTAMALAMVVTLSNGMTVMAAENNAGDSSEIKYQEPVEITEFSDVESTEQEAYYEHK